jgi:hypothetical protein
MANEITLSLSLAVRNGNYDESVADSARVDQTTQRAASGVVVVGSNAVQTIALGDVTTAGYASFRNLSTATSGTAYIALGKYDGTNLHEFVQLRRGQPAMLPLIGNVSVGARSYGTPANLRYIILAE